MSAVVPMKLVTIVTEGLLKSQIIEVLQAHGVTGFTISRVEGEGSRGVRASDWEGPNLKIESIVSPSTSQKILTDISEKFFNHYAVVAWLTEISVLRGDKFSNA